MSNSKSSREMFPLGLPIDPNMQISVYDGWDGLVWQGQGGNRSQIQLPRGLYTVRLEVNNEIHEEVVRLTEGKDLGQFQPRRYSAAPIAGNSLSHEYYSNSAEALSKTHTRPPLTSDSQPNSGLFVFLRTIDMERGHRIATSLGAKLSLRNVEGREIALFTEPQVIRNSQFGFLAFSAAAVAGLYRLVYSGTPRREVPIYLFPNFQTQVFIIQTGRPLLEGMRLFMEPPGDGFHPGSPYALAADKAMELLMNRSDRLPVDAEHMLIDQKFQNPVFGLIGAYTMARRLRASSVDAVLDPLGLNNLDTILRNLNNLIPQCPDVQALSLLRDEITPSGNAVPVFAQPPMFRAGWDAVLRAARRDEDLIVDGSLCDRITTRILADSPWTTWDPLPASRAGSVRRRTPGAQFPISGVEGMREAPLRVESARNVRANVLPSDLEVAETPERNRKRRKKLKEPSWMQAAFLSALQREQSRLWRAGRTKQMPKVSVYDIARQTGTTPKAVMREVEELDLLSADERSRILHANWSKLGDMLMNADRIPFRALLIPIHPQLMASVEIVHGRELKQEPTADGSPSIADKGP